MFTFHDLRRRSRLLFVHACARVQQHADKIGVVRAAPRRPRTIARSSRRFGGKMPAYRPG